MILRKGSQFFQLRRILLEARPDQALDIICQLVVAGKEPPPERDSIGLIVKFLRIKLIKLVPSGSPYEGPPHRLYYG